MQGFLLKRSTEVETASVRQPNPKKFRAHCCCAIQNIASSGEEDIYPLPGHKQSSLTMGLLISATSLPNSACIWGSVLVPHSNSWVLTPVHNKNLYYYSLPILYLVYKAATLSLVCPYPMWPKDALKHLLQVSQEKVSSSHR